MVFERTTTQYTPLTPRVDSHGKMWIKAIAHGALVALTPYKIILNEYGYVTAALADDTTAHEYWVGFPENAIDLGAEDWLQVGGYCASIITPSLISVVGYALRIYDGAIALVSADYSGLAGQFAALCDATTATTHNVMLAGKMIIGQT